MAESAEHDMVILKITMKNETGKHYISLDRDDYTCYLDEEEMLLQAGIVSKVEKIE